MGLNSSTSQNSPAPTTTNWNNYNDRNRNGTSMPNTPNGVSASSTNATPRYHTGLHFPPTAPSPPYVSPTQSPLTPRPPRLPSPSPSLERIQSNYAALQLEADTARAIRLSLLENNNTNRTSNASQLTVRMPATASSRGASAAAASSTTSTISQNRGINVAGVSSITTVNSNSRPANVQQSYRSIPTSTSMQSRATGVVSASSITSQNREFNRIVISSNVPRHPLFDDSDGLLNSRVPPVRLRRLISSTPSQSTGTTASSIAPLSSQNRGINVAPVSSTISTSLQPRKNNFVQAKTAPNDSSPKVEITFDCSICMEFNDKDIIVATECGHVFHKDCVTPWIESAGNCPTCRVRVTVASLRKIYVSVSSNNNASASPTASTATNSRNNTNNNMNRRKNHSRGTTLPTMFGRSIWLSSTNKQMTEVSMATYIAQKFHLAPQTFSVKSLQKAGTMQSPTQRYVSFKVSVDTENTFNTLKNSAWPAMFRTREFIEHNR